MLASKSLRMGISGTNFEAEYWYYSTHSEFHVILRVCTSGVQKELILHISIALFLQKNLKAFQLLFHSNMHIHCIIYIFFPSF